MHNDIFIDKRKKKIEILHKNVHYIKFMNGDLVKLHS
jgi:hypothetical protein